MPQGENTLVDGTGSQSSFTRWGDYSAMSVDPADDCTFWYTNEYFTTGTGWRTRIGTFKFSSCSGTSSDPSPDIKANGSDGPITITTNDTLTVAISLDAGNGAGQNADWWAAANTSFSGWFYYSLTGGWLSGLTVTHQGPLADLSSTNILNGASGLPTGTYTIYFAVDTTMDGSVSSPVYSDSVVVTVTQ
jgi:hypothetical protein